MAVSKPLAGAQIDRAAPAAQGILGAWAFNEGAGSRVGDSVSKANDSFGIAANLAWKNGGFFNGSSSSVVVPNKNFPFLKSTPFSGFAEVEWKSSGAIQCIFGTWVQSTSPGWMFYVTSTGALRLIFTDAGGTNYFNRYSTRTLDARRHTVGFTYDGSAANTGIKLFLDGAELAGSNTTNGTADPGTLAGANLYIGRNASAASTVYWFNGGINGAALYGAKLDPMLARSVTSNLWQLWPDDQIVFAPAAGTTGTSSATVTLTGSATGAVAVAGASSQTLPLTGTSTGAVSVAGASAGTVNLTGTATGAAAVAGASSATVSLTGSATGTSAIAGASSGTVDLAGTATGTIPPLAVSGASAGTFDLSGTSTASVAVAGASAGTVALTGTAAGTAPVAGASSSTLALTGSAAGTVAVAGASSVTIALTGSATGLVQNFSAVSNGTFTLAGTATGSVDVAGASAAQIDIGGAAAFTIRTILGSSAGRVQTSASRTEALNSADRQNTYNPERIAAGSGKRGSNTQTQRR